MNEKDNHMIFVGIFEESIRHVLTIFFCFAMELACNGTWEFAVMLHMGARIAPPQIHQYQLSIRALALYYVPMFVLKIKYQALVINARALFLTREC